MSETTKERMERHRKAWHVERQQLEQLKVEFYALVQRIDDARRLTDAAHQHYKDHKAIWRTGRAWNVTDADNAAMIHKLGKL